MTEQPAIKTRGLTKRFGAVLAVDALDLEVRRGEVYGLIGPNGAGKTTTIRMLLGLSRPTGGTIEILGREVAQAGPALRQAIGFVGEDQPMYDYMRVSACIDFARSFYPTWDQELAFRIADVFRLPLSARVGTLSKGMRSQLALVLAMSPRPPLLILDEPTSGLDPLARRDFLSTVMGDAIGPDQSVLLSSHILTEVERVVDRVGIIARGRLLTVRDIDALKTSHKRVRVVFQGEPPADALNHPAITGLQREGSGFLLTISSDLEEVLASLNRHPLFALEVLDMTLEETFVHYAQDNRGR
jgi:ABC-2 type transport system ATP-binding protein